MSKKRIIIIAISLIFVIVVVAAILSRNGGKDAITVQTAKVQKQKVVETVTATGRIQPQTQVKISADVAAKITKLGVEEGEESRRHGVVSLQHGADSQGIRSLSGECRRR